MQAHYTKSAKNLSLILAAALVFLGASDANAGRFPDQPVSIIVPFSAGGPTDLIARLIAKSMSASLGKPFMVENITGAGGTIAAARVARAPANGYTLFLHNAGHATAPSLYSNLSYSPVDSFAPIGQIADFPMILATRRNLPANDFKELLAYIRANGDSVKMANAGVGGVTHLCGMLFMNAIDTKLTSVPYRGSVQAQAGLMSGEVDIMCDSVSSNVGLIKKGKIKAYAVTSRTRVAALPDVPSFDEVGLKEMRISSWHGLYAPKETPQAVIDTLNAALQKAVKDADVVKKLTGIGAEPVPLALVTPAALQAQLKSEIDKWAPFIKKASNYAD